jgi:acetyltransferase-like isoleucine patch superfamily enzyme
VQAQAAWKRADVTLEIDPDAWIGPDVRIRVDPDSTSRLHIGAGAVLDGRCRINLRGGEIVIAARTTIRERVLLNVRGQLLIGADSIVSHATVIHCAEQVILGDRVGVAEYVSIADSVHFHTDDGVRVFDNVRSAPVVIGADTWLCPKVTVTSGVRIGARCVIASNVVVTKDVGDDGTIVGAANRTLERRPIRHDRTKNLAS